MGTLRDRMYRSGPIWKYLVNRKSPLTRVANVAGAAAGSHTVADIKKGDRIISVLYHQASAALTDQTSEFGGVSTTPATKRGYGALVEVDGVIDNTEGTTSASGTLIVTWEALGS